MDWRTQARRLTYLAHRWTGIAGCVLMLLWFGSGITMLYVGYPKLTPWERLAALPALAGGHDSPPLAPPPADMPAGALMLTSIRGAPHYVVTAPDGTHAWPMHGTAPAGPASARQAEHAAQHHAGGAPVRHDGLIDEDRWTHARGLNPHRPLHRIQVEGDAPGTLYVSSATGQVVLDAPRSQQRWNYVGAWLHWVYLFRDRPVDPGWSWLVIGLSALCTVTAISGTVVGVWRWRFRGRYKTGSRSPYRDTAMRWHHLAGLVFSAFICAWIFSGLMSMNPLGVFDPRHNRPDLMAYREAPAAPPADRASPSAALAALRREGFEAVELHWRRLDGQDYLLAFNAHADSRVVTGTPAAPLVRTEWAVADILPAARRLFPQAMRSHQRLDRHDAYYYARHPEAMNGAAMRSLPALRLDFDDPGDTRVYIDLRTGDVATSLDRTQRLGRWLFYFLHSWDVPALLQHTRSRDLALILLSLGGVAVSATGIVIGWRRLRGPPRPRPTPARAAAPHGRHTTVQHP